MILLLAVAASVATHPPAKSAAPDPTVLADASHAIEMGRLQEAKLLIARAISVGFRGDPVQRLTANLAFASGNYLQALVGYQHLVGSSNRPAGECEKGAVAALQIGRVADAKPFVDCAVVPANASWRAWNARGVYADLTQDWPMADEAFAQARKLAPNEARVANNQGWSKLLRGDWAGAVTVLEEAASLDSKSDRIANNLELAKSGLTADLPERHPGESDQDWAARLNDAGVAAELTGDRKRAVSAFTQALDVSPAWYARASNNLDALSSN
jgi:Flp pilus assembly protein TadD